MKIALVRSSRKLNWPWWVLGVVVVWSALGIAAILLSRHLGRPVQLCLIRRTTHVPCPTCGLTRGVLCLLRGEPIRGWLYNPLLFSALIVFAGLTAVRVAFGRVLSIEFSRTERRIAWLLAILLFFANWAYIIIYVG